MRFQSRQTLAGTLTTGVFHLALVLSSWCWARPASADWARDMFEVTKHDFGTIAAGAKAEFSFKFTNVQALQLHPVIVHARC